MFGLNFCFLTNLKARTHGLKATALLSIFLLSLVALGLTGCGGGSEGTGSVDIRGKVVSKETGED